MDILPEEHANEILPQIEAWIKEDNYKNESQIPGTQSFVSTMLELYAVVYGTKDYIKRGDMNISSSFNFAELLKQNEEAINEIIKIEKNPIRRMRFFTYFLDYLYSYYIWSIDHTAPYLRFSFDPLRYEVRGSFLNHIPEIEKVFHSLLQNNTLKCLYETPHEIMMNDRISECMFNISALKDDFKDIMNKLLKLNGKSTNSDQTDTENKSDNLDNKNDTKLY